MKCIALQISLLYVGLKKKRNIQIETKQESNHSLQITTCMLNQHKSSSTWKQMWQEWKQLSLKKNGQIDLCRMSDIQEKGQTENTCRSNKLEKYPFKEYSKFVNRRQCNNLWIAEDYENRGTCKCP